MTERRTGFFDLVLYGIVLVLVVGLLQRCAPGRKIVREIKRTMSDGCKAM